MKKICLLITMLGWGAGVACAQYLTGCVTDATNNDSIPFATISYKGHGISAITDIHGRYTIPRRMGWELTFSCVGYKSQTKTLMNAHDSILNVQLKPDSRQLSEVTVKVKRQRYSRKDNPAVELMRKVIAANKKQNLSHHDYYQYNKYEKLLLAANDLSEEQLGRRPFSKAPWLLEQVERCPYNDKLILPVSIDETVSKKVYRRWPHAEKTIIRGQMASGVNDLFQTGDAINVAMKDVFTDLDLYQDQIRMLQYPFTSPIGKDAIAFYRFYIADTIRIENDSCIHLQFLPNNQQDFGFRGDLYVLNDSSYHVRRCELTIPKRSDVNFVEELRVSQEFHRLGNGEWVLGADDMICELQFVGFLQRMIAIRTTRYTDYAFDELPKSLFKGKSKLVREADAGMRPDSFWEQYRPTMLTKGESSMDAFVKNIEQMKGFKYVMLGLKALIENHVETGTPNKIDIGPVNTIITHNFVDGMRTRASGQTTANLNRHFFGKGYYAYGWGSHQSYYDAELTYSFNAKEYLPREFPKRTITLQSTYDICSPSDHFLPTDKDNFLVAFKWAEVNKMMTYNRQQLLFEYEHEWGLKTTFRLKRERNEARGALSFRPLRTTELHGELRFAPGETYVNTKQRRLTINLDQPVFTIAWSVGMKGFLGGNHAYHFTEAMIYKRFWMKSWGKIDTHLKGGAQWSRVPYPLLIHPAANQSYIIEEGTFSLINNMEFINDRYASLMVSWDMNGKLLNRVPMLRRLKWREYLGLNLLWGTLTDKNNPTKNSSQPVFPDGSHVMDSDKPYVEAIAGIHNIFKFFHVEYVRRLTYLDLPTSEKWGFRYVMRMTF